MGRKRIYYRVAVNIVRLTEQVVSIICGRALFAIGVVSCGNAISFAPGREFWVANVSPIESGID